MPLPELLPWRRVLTWLAVSDVLAVVGGLAIAHWLRYQALAGWLVLTNAPDMPVLLPVAIGGVWLISYMAVGLYRRSHLVAGIEEYRLVATAGVLTSLSVIVLSYFRAHPAISRGFLLVALAVVTLLAAIGRFLIRRLIYRAARNGHCLDRVLIVGSDRQAVTLARQLQGSPPASAQVVGFLADYSPVGFEPMPGLRVLGEPGQLLDVAARVGATRAIVVEASLSWESLRAMVLQMHIAHGLEVRLVPGIFDLHATPMRSEQIGPVVTLAPQPSRVTGFDAVLKRAEDLVAAVVLLVLSLPLLAVLRIRSWATRRPMLITHRYAVHRGGELRVWHVAGGEWVRRWHVARLPELVEVIRGRMSFIGPRLIAPDAVKQYVPMAAILGAARPGFIGPWWLAGMKRPVDINDEIAYDVHYLYNYSIWLDAQILVQAFRGLSGGTPRMAGAGQAVRASVPGPG